MLVVPHTNPICHSVPRPQGLEVKRAVLETPEVPFILAGDIMLEALYVHETGWYCFDVRQ